MTTPIEIKQLKKENQHLKLDLEFDKQKIKVLYEEIESKNNLIANMSSCITDFARTWFESVQKEIILGHLGTKIKKD